MTLSTNDIARLIDLSSVKAETCETDVEKLIETAIKYNCLVVYVLQSHIPKVKSLLEKNNNATRPYIGGAIGFPSGAESTSIKISQAKELIKSGCDEFDMVMNIGMLLSGKYTYVEQEIKAIVDVVNGKPLKVIIEVSYLNDEQIKKACNIIANSKAQYVKTGTGWANKTTLRHIKIIKSVVGNDLGIKASGGIRDLDTVIKFYSLGVTRFGLNVVSGVNILEASKIKEISK